MLLLDADILVDILRGHGPALDWFVGLDEIPSVPGLVVMELVQGATDSVGLLKAMKLTAPLPRIWPTQTDCEKALADFRRYRLSHNLGLLDSLIAACALGLPATLCTFNVKHYSVISDLDIRQPYHR